MPENHVLPLVNNRFDPSDGQVKFISQIIKADAVNHTPVHNPAVSLIRHPFVYQVRHLTAGYLRILVHLRLLRLTLTRLVPLLLPVLRVLVRFRVHFLTVTLAI